MDWLYIYKVWAKSVPQMKKVAKKMIMLEKQGWICIFGDLVLPLR